MRLLCALTILILQWDIYDFNQCPSKGCNLGIPDALNVHLVPHTHDDVGWVNTVDGYFNTQVNSILNSVIEALLTNASYRFTYVEMVFFHMWWTKQADYVRQLVKDLVSSGRLGFSLGGWSMADEATVYYADLIDDLTMGREFLYRLFGPCVAPKIAWQIDPFGHSRDAADIFIEADYSAVVFQRISFNEKQQRRQNRTLQLLWNTAASETDTRHQILAHILYGDYSYPNGVCLNSACFTDDGPSGVANTELDAFYNLVEDWASGYPTNHVLIPIGGDFSHARAKMDFEVVDRFIGNHTDATGKKLNVFYSTTDCYVEALDKALENSRQLDRRSGDFFPYADREHNYWVGYYTSRPSFKQYVRKMSLLLTISEQLNALLPTLEAAEVIHALRQEMGIVQHHDAVAGTAKQFVSDDYVRRLNAAGYACEQIVSKAISVLIARDDEAETQWQFCNLRNISVCEATESSRGHPTLFQVTVYNPLGWDVNNQWLRIPLYINLTDNLHVTVREVGHSQDLTYQIIPILSRTEMIPERVLTKSKANVELVFSATQGNRAIPSIGFRTFQVNARPQSVSGTFNVPRQKPENESESKFFDFELDHTAENIVLLATHRDSGRRFTVNATLMYYLGEADSGEVSGAYVFHPKDNGAVHQFPHPAFKIVEGACLKEIWACYSDWATLVVRLYADMRLETEWTVGPLPNEDSVEVIARYTVEEQTQSQDTYLGKGAFYTDSSGRRPIRRTRNKRNSEDFVASNYYPVINRILLKGVSTDLSGNSLKIGFAVYTDRAQGGSSLRDGQIELMLHRRLLLDDNLGVGEPLRENGADGEGSIVRGNHWIYLDELSALEEKDRRRATLAVRPPVPIFRKLLDPPRKIQRPYWRGLTVNLPDHIHLLSLVSWPLVQQNDNLSQWLLRLENMRPFKETEPHHLDVTTLFTGFKITKAIETILTADKQVNERRRYKWLSDPIRTRRTELKNVQYRDKRVILTLHPETIHTFVVHFEPV